MSLENHERGRMLTNVRRSGDTNPPNPPDERRRAARRIATEAVDADECAELLGMLGLTAEDGILPADE